MAWAFVQRKEQALTNNASQTIRFTLNTVAGNRAFLAVTTWNMVTSVAVSDAKNGSWTQDVSKTTVSPNGGIVAVFSVQLAAQLLSTDDITITLTTSGGSYGGYVAILEYSGLSTASAAVDVSAANSVNNASPASGNTAATTAANELVLCIYGEDGEGGVWSLAPTGTVRVNMMGSTTDGDLWIADKDSGASGSVQSTSGTLTGATGWGMLCVVYKLAGGTNFPRTISASVAHSAAVARAVANTRTQAPSVAHSATVARQVANTRAASSTIAHTVTMGRVLSLPRTVTASVAHSAVVGRAVANARLLTSGIAHSAVVGRALTLTRTTGSAIAHSAPVSFVINGGAANLIRTITSSVAHSATVQRAVANTRTLSSGIAHSAAVTRALGLTRGASSSIAHSAAVSRALALGRGVSSGIAHSAALGRAGAFVRGIASAIAHTVSILAPSSKDIRQLVLRSAHDSASVTVGSAHDSASVIVR